MIRDLIGSQCSCLRIGVILSHFLAPVTRRAAEFWTFCQTHENAGLMLKALRSVVPSTISVSPDTFSGDYPDAESVLTLVEQADTTSEISFSEWQRVKCDDGKQRTKIVVCKLPADDFLQKVTRVVEDFRDHAGRVNTQYVELKKLKDSLGELSSVVRLKQPNKIDSL